MSVTYEVSKKIDWNGVPAPIGLTVYVTKVTEKSSYDIKTGVHTTVTMREVVQTFKIDTDTHEVIS
jgi:hypothetical protein